MAYVKLKDSVRVRDLAGGYFSASKAKWTSEYEELKNLALNSIKITGVNFIEERFIKDQLFENGAVGLDRLAGMWAQVAGAGGVNEYGNPIYLVFNYQNGINYQRLAYYSPDDAGAYMIYALPTGMAMAKIVKHTADIIKECDNAIYQNLKACKSPLMVVTKDPDMMLSIKQAIQQQQDGEPVIITSSDIGEAVKGIELKTPFLVDKYAEYRDMEREHLLSKLGIISANEDKKERVQSAEVNAGVGKAVDYIYMLVDTFNKQMETYGLPYSMEFNGALEDLYEENENNERLEDNDKLEYNSI